MASRIAMTYIPLTDALIWAITASGCGVIIGYWLRGRCRGCKAQERASARKEYPHVWRDRPGIED